MKLFLCLALFSLSSAEPLCRKNLHQNLSDHNHLDQAHNVYKRERGRGFTWSGDCRISSAGGYSYDVYIPSAGNCYLTHEGCSSSTSSDGNRIKKIHDVHTKSSGSAYIKYCSSSFSGPLAHDIYIESAGNVRIKDCCASPSGKLSNKFSLIHDVHTKSSGSAYIEYCSSSSSGPLAHDIYIESAGNVRITNSCSSHCGKLGHDVKMSSSGGLIITNCCASTCRELFKNVIRRASGSCSVSGSCR